MEFVPQWATVAIADKTLTAYGHYYVHFCQFLVKIHTKLVKYRLYSDFFDILRQKNH